MNNREEALKKWREEGGKVKSRREKFEKTPTRKLAIEIQCEICMGGEDEPGIRNHIKGCTSPQCPLYIYRPYK